MFFAAGQEARHIAMNHYMPVCSTKRQIANLVEARVVLSILHVSRVFFFDIFPMRLLCWHVKEEARTRALPKMGVKSMF